LSTGAWADGSSWAKLTAPLAASGVSVVQAPLPLTSFHDDVAALDRTLERAVLAIIRNFPLHQPSVLTAAASSA